MTMLGDFLRGFFDGRYVIPWQREGPQRPQRPKGTVDPNIVPPGAKGVITLPTEPACREELEEALLDAGVEFHDVSVTSKPLPGLEFNSIGPPKSPHPPRGPRVAGGGDNRRWRCRGECGKLWTFEELQDGLASGACPECGGPTIMEDSQP